MEFLTSKKDPRKNPSSQFPDLLEHLGMPALQPITTNIKEKKMTYNLCSMYWPFFITKNCPGLNSMFRITKDFGKLERENKNTRILFLSKWEQAT